MSRFSNPDLPIGVAPIRQSGQVTSFVIYMGCTSKSRVTHSQKIWVKFHTHCVRDSYIHQALFKLYPPFGMDSYSTSVDMYSAEGNTYAPMRMVIFETMCALPTQAPLRNVVAYMKKVARGLSRMAKLLENEHYEIVLAETTLSQL